MLLRILNMARNRKKGRQNRKSKRIKTAQQKNHIRSGASFVNKCKDWCKKPKKSPKRAYLFTMEGIDA